MARLLGDRVLPQSVQSQRRRLRSRLRDLREPIRSRRASMIPGPDVIGSVESQLNDLRTRAVRRQGFVEMMRSARDSGSSNGGTEGNTSSENSESEGDRGNTAENRVNI